MIDQEDHYSTSKNMLPIFIKGQRREPDEKEIKKALAIVRLFGSQDIGSDAKQWLLKQSGELRFKWLLVHADDGVIWGGGITGPC